MLFSSECSRCEASVSVADEGLGSASERLILSEQFRERARGDDARGLVEFEREQDALVTSDQIVGPGGSGQREQEMVFRFRIAVDAWQSLYVLCKLVYLLLQAASVVGLDALGDAGLAQCSARFVG